MLYLSRDYVPSWTEADAFREWYQNCFNLAPRPFILEQNTTNTEIQITAHRITEAVEDSPGRELLGYIKYIKRTGTVELTNFNAALEIQHLNLGRTTKRHDSKTAGTHGEGFKVAALVMARENREIRIASSSAYWSFGFRGSAEDKFACQITKPAASTIKKHKDSLLSKTLNGQVREDLTSYIHQDVSVRISTIKGDGFITEAEFRRWTKVSIDLHCPSPDKIIRTTSGDLLLDPTFAGRIYLKGLLVLDNGPWATRRETYTVGYDFASGSINRDRERMMDPTEEAQIIAEIWEAAIDQRPDLTKRYFDLFDNGDSKDVAFSDRVVSKRMAGHVWQHLLKDMPEYFFYNAKSEHWSSISHQTYLIETELKKKPRLLTNELWNTLRKFNLVKTPEEHIDRKFLSSRVVPIPADNFAQSIDRMLRAAMKMDLPFTRFKLVYVRSEQISIGVRMDYTRARVLIHEKWLDFDEAHRSTSCAISKLEEAQRKQTAVFACDHVVEDLFEMILKTVKERYGYSSSTIDSFRSKGRELFRQTPRDIQVIPGSVPGQLRVNWTCNDAGVLLKHHGDNIFFYPSDTFTNVSFESTRLNFKFEKNRYVVIKDNSDSFGEYIALVHDVLPGSVDCQDTPHLSISKYSFFRSTSVLWDSKAPLANDNDATPIEMLLHFSEPRRMGTPSDSEVVAIDDIDRAEPVRAGFDIVHCVQAPVVHPMAVYRLCDSIVEFLESGNAVKVDVSSVKKFCVPQSPRLDSLTVRELARIQGFPDDFVFYGSERQQYEHVTFAQPPAVARAAAECINTVIKRFREVKLGDGEGCQRPNKRRRDDNAPSQEVSREAA
ncbi:hypothetical protein N0V92_004827 [Colletotrichum tropicale]|nr:hypothetical protein N0V92_004827 [Colletotrichum tropicale]